MALKVSFFSGGLEEQARTVGHMAEVAFTSIAVLVPEVQRLSMSAFTEIIGNEDGVARRDVPVLYSSCVHFL